MITWVKSSRLEKEGKEPLDLEGKGQALDWGKMGATQFWTITLLSDSQSLPHMQSRTIGIAGLLNETLQLLRQELCYVGREERCEKVVSSIL